MQLLISVVNAGEAAAAAAGGADILDVKNPAEGSLGAPVPETVQQIRRAAPRPARLSVAIGDMPDLPGTAALAALGAAACGADYVKIGLWGPRDPAGAERLLAQAVRAVAAYPGVTVIAAAYGDAARTGTLDPRLLPSVAATAGCAGCLLDTAIKDGCCLFDFLAPDTLRELAAEAHASGLLFALAGALQAQHLALVHDIGADIVGLRSAVCVDGRRTAPLDPARLATLREAAAGM